MRMDHRIYGRLPRTDLGTYGTRRFPKGIAGQSLAPVPGGGVPLTSNPITISRTFEQGLVGPHGVTERWSYVVPPLRRAKMESALINIVRQVGPGALSDVTASIRVIRKGTEDRIITSQPSIARAHLFNGTVGADAPSHHVGPLELFEGDELMSLSVDLCTGGSCAHYISAVLTEFDAVDKVIDANISGFGSLGGLSVPQGITGPNTLVGGGTLFSSPAPTASPTTTQTGPRAKVAIPIYTWDGRRIS